MKNKIDDLRDHLFTTIEKLNDDDNPMDVAHARAVADVANTIIDTAKVELRYMELTGHDATTFIPLIKPEDAEKPMLSIASKNGKGNGLFSRSWRK